MLVNNFGPTYQALAPAIPSAAEPESPSQSEPDLQDEMSWRDYARPIVAGCAGAAAGLALGAVPILGQLTSVFGTAIAVGAIGAGVVGHAVWSATEGLNEPDRGALGICVGMPLAATAGLAGLYYGGGAAALLVHSFASSLSYNPAAMALTAAVGAGVGALWAMGAFREEDQSKTSGNA